MFKKPVGRPKRVEAEVVEAPVEVKQPVVTAAPEEVAPHKTMRYHDTEEPRTFEACEVIPAGWTKINTKWRTDRDGKWIIDKGE